MRAWCWNMKTLNTVFHKINVIPVLRTVITGAVGLTASRDVMAITPAGGVCGASLAAFVDRASFYILGSVILEKCALLETTHTWPKDIIPPLTSCNMMTNKIRFPSHFLWHFLFPHLAPCLLLLRSILIIVTVYGDCGGWVTGSLIVIFRSSSRTTFMILLVKASVSALEDMSACSNMPQSLVPKPLRFFIILQYIYSLC